MKISKATIRLAAQKIASSVKPEKIILFGSYAHGVPNKDSDVDFLVIVRGATRKKRRESFLKASQALRYREFPVDIVVRSQKDIPWRLRSGDFFLRDIFSRGQVMYEKTTR